MSGWERFIHAITAHFRRRRFAALLKLEPGLLTQRILDVGGSFHFWRKVGVDLAQHDITLLNVVNNAHLTDTGGADVGRFVLYDGRSIPWPDKTFDWAFSNSVIEHVAPADRKQFCMELRRVGGRVLVQTPAFGFPLEPHFVMPFLHWLPRRMGRAVAPYTPWAILSRQSRVKVNEYFDEVRLLGRKELQGYFPEARIVTERVLGVPKSYIAVSPAEGTLSPRNA